jgi:hypothetical protein
MENYSLNSRHLQVAARELINDNAESLIRYIYTPILGPESKSGGSPTLSGQEPQSKDKAEEKDKKVSQPDEKIQETNKIHEVFNDREVRVGLSIRILAKTDRYHDETLINLILDDIEFLRKHSDYLLSFKDPKARKAALDEEYALVQGYIDMSDTISLNQEVDTSSRINRFASDRDGNCVIV